MNLTMLAAGIAAVLGMLLAGHAAYRLLTWGLLLPYQLVFGIALIVLAAFLHRRARR
jgi:hypothetical protein